MTGFKTRLATHDDVAEILDVVKGSWARTYDPIIGEAERKKISDKKHVPSLFLSEIDNSDACSIIAVDQANAVIGHTGGQIRGERTFFIDHLHVMPTWFGKGVAAAIIQTLANEVRPIADRIELTVLSNNERAIGFYEKAGFIKAKGDNEDDGLAGVPSFLMRLDISQD